MTMPGAIGWLGILRVGLVQTGLGAIVVLTTSTLNRVMVVELALPAMLPGALVAVHYAVQTLRPRWGYGSDVGGRRTPWIVGGMATLALGGTAAAAATAWMATAPLAGTVAAFLAFLVIGVGVGASGTSLLVLLATHVAPTRRPAAATIVWLMMIAGFAVTAGTAGALLDPYSPERLVLVTAGVGALALVVTVAAVWGLEQRSDPVPAQAGTEARPSFRVAFGEVWREAPSRRFAVFVFVSMLAYSGQDLILEPYAGLVFGYSLGQSTALSGVHHGGVFAGMVLVGAVCTALGGLRIGAMGSWVVGGCLLSSLALLGLTAGAEAAAWWQLRLNVFVLGLGNGAFAVAAIGSMMTLAASGKGAREGTRMGLFGAAQAIAFGLGGFAGTVAVDLGRVAMGSAPAAYALVFGAEALLFVVSAVLAWRVGRDSRSLDDPGKARRMGVTTLGDGVIAGVAR